MAGFLAQPLPDLSSWVAPRRNVLASLGAGLASGRTFGEGVANALSALPAAQQADDAYATTQKAEADRQARLKDQLALRSKYAKFFADQGEGQIADLVGDPEGPDPGDTYWKWRAAAAPDKPKLQVVDGNLLSIGPDNSVQTLWQKPTTARAGAPSGFRWTSQGDSLEPIPGGPQDPAVKTKGAAAKPTDAQVRATSLLQVVTPDALLLIGDGTSKNPGIYSALGNGGDQAMNGVDVFGAKPLAGLTSQDYQRASNAVTNIAQSYLYAISGQAAPEGEVRKIVDSITPKPFENPQAVADKKQRLGVYVQAIKNAAERGVFAPDNDPTYSGGAAPSSKVLTYNPSTGELE